MNVSKVSVWKAEMFADGNPRWIIDVYIEGEDSVPIKIVSKIKPIINDDSLQESRSTWQKSKIKRNRKKIFTTRHEQRMSG